MYIYLSIYVQFLSGVQFFETPWTVAHQAPLSMEFSREGYWSGLPFSIPGDLPDPGIETVSLASPALDSLPLCYLGSPIYIKTLCYQINLSSAITSISIFPYLFVAFYMTHFCFVLFYCISIYFISLCVWKCAQIPLCHAPSYMLYKYWLSHFHSNIMK